MTQLGIWATRRARFAFARRDVRGVEAPLASATKDGVLLRTDLEFSVWNPDSDISNYKLVEPDDFVIGLRSFQHGISHSTVKGIVSPAYTVLRAVCDLEPRYYKHYFRSGLLISQLANITQGIRQGQAIDIEAFQNLLVPVPPLEEQRRIADFLDGESAKLDRGERLALRMIEVLQERDQATIDQELSGLDESHILPISAVCEKILDCVNKTAPVANEETPYRMIRTSNIRRGKVDVEQTYRVTEEVFRRWNRRGQPKPGDILFTRQAPVGEAGLLRSDSPVFLGQQVMLFRPSRRIIPEFLLYNFLGSFMKSQFELASAGSAHTHMRVHDCVKLKAFCPPIESQIAISARVKKVVEQGEELRSAGDRQARLLAERKQALITAAVTGQFDVSTASGRGIED
ncbi:restriction endonuclease subunit S [Micromonospora tulbaghiae]|uniref:restriction endonuclease subunit S n=1 Tax=Micromonospora tulbaghiae TaxID=479978 RepID=UPI003EBE3E3F